MYGMKWPYPFPKLKRYSHHLMAFDLVQQRHCLHNGKQRPQQKAALLSLTVQELMFVCLSHYSTRVSGTEIARFSTISQLHSGLLGSWWEKLYFTITS